MNEQDQILTSDEVWLSLDPASKGHIYIGLPKNSHGIYIPIDSLVVLPLDLDQEGTTAHIVALNKVVEKLRKHIDTFNT